jgi:hypothetical protein
LVFSIKNRKKWGQKPTLKIGPQPYGILAFLRFSHAKILYYNSIVSLHASPAPADAFLATILTPHENIFMLPENKFSPAMPPALAPQGFAGTKIFPSYLYCLPYIQKIKTSFLSSPKSPQPYSGKGLRELKFFSEEG